jgi:hypothetical protein
MIPEPHATFLQAALPGLESHPQIVGVAAGGSYASNSMDAFSDLDLVIAVEPDAYGAIIGERHAVAQRLGPLLAAFTGEHVGEPRLLICLYGPYARGALLHVDLKFVSAEDIARRVEDPVVLWERDGRVSAALALDVARYPQPDLQWIEDRFWIWVHYAASKVGRGELFEALDFLAALRAQALGPLALASAGARPSGVRRIEVAAPDFAAALGATVAAHDKASLASAILAAVALYRTLRTAMGPPGLRVNRAAEEAAVGYLDEISGGAADAANRYASPR